MVDVIKNIQTMRFRFKVITNGNLRLLVVISNYRRNRLKTKGNHIAQCGNQTETELKKDSKKFHMRCITYGS